MTNNREKGIKNQRDRPKSEFRLGLSKALHVALCKWSILGMCIKDY